MNTLYLGIEEDSGGGVHAGNTFLKTQNFKTKKKKHLKFTQNSRLANQKVLLFVISVTVRESVL